LGCVFTLGAWLLTAILLQPFYGEELGEVVGLAATETSELTLPTTNPGGEDFAAPQDCVSCVVCDPVKRSGGCRRFFADVLLWTVREGADENWAQVITPQNLSGLLATNAGTATLVDAPFDWRAGLRVGMSIQRSDDFEITLYYTNFHTSATNQASGQVYSAFMGNFYVENTDGANFGPYYRHASILWDIYFHSIDFEISRNFVIGSNLELKPFLGLKTAIINQSIKTRWLNPINTLTKQYSFTSATEDQNPNFWGIGPSLGVTMAMPLCEKDKYSLKLFGSPSGAILLGHWTCSEVYKNNQPNTITIDMDSITGAATMLRGVVGFEWQQYFSRATSTVRLGYEAQLWLNQVQFYSYNMGRLNNVMSLQGGFAEWSINF
jgi:hypothetical protein